MKNFLKSRRIEKDLTQEDMARITNASLTQIRNIERERSIPSVLLALKLKKALQLKTIEELFDLEDTD